MFRRIFEMLPHILSIPFSHWLLCRLFPVLPGNGRVTQEDLVVGGYLIPKGVSLMVVEDWEILVAVALETCCLCRMSLF